MASEKFLFADAAGNATEDNAAVSVYASTASADRLVKTNSSGKIDNTLINFSAFERQFLVRVGSSTNLTLSAPGAAIDGVTLTSGDSFLAFGQTTASQNGIYVFNGAAAPATRRSDYNENGEIRGSDVTFIQEGTYAEKGYILVTNDTIVVDTTALNYTPLGVALITDGTGLSYSGTTLNVNLQSAEGIQFIGDNLAVKVADFAGLGLIDDGSNNLAIDFAVTTGGGANLNSSRAVKGSDLVNFAAGQGANIIGFDKTAVAAYTTATTVEQAIIDAFGYAQAPGVLYTAGTGGVNKAALVYVSANDTILPFSTVTSAQSAVGLAATATIAGSPVKVVSDSTVLTSVLTGATAGTKYYWSGSAVTSTLPSAVNTYVWEVGTAKNATDLHVNVKYVKRNSAI